MKKIVSQKRIPKVEPVFNKNHKQIGVLVPREEYEIISTTETVVIKKSPQVYLPLEAYKNFVLKKKKWQEIQKKEGVRWVKVQVNTPTKKSKSSSKREK